MNNTSWFFTKGVFVYTLYPNNFVTKAMKRNMHIHTYLYLRECLKLKKNVLNIFFIVYIRKFELGFW